MTQRPNMPPRGTRTRLVRHTEMSRMPKVFLTDATVRDYHLKGITEMRDSNARLDIQIDATVKRLAEDGYRDPLGEAKELRKYHRAFSKPRNGLTKDGTMIYFARKHDCEACALKPKCCPNGPARKIARSVYEAARDKVRAIAKTEAYAVSCRERKKVEMLFGHLKRILRLGRLRLRGPSGAKDEFRHSDRCDRQAPRRRRV